MKKIKIMDKTMKLPEDFVIDSRLYHKNPLWPKYIEWLNKKYNLKFFGNQDAFYGVYYGSPLYTTEIDKNTLVTFISLYYWYAAINGTPNFTDMCTKLGSCVGLPLVNTSDTVVGANMSDSILYTVGTIVTTNDVLIIADNNCYANKDNYIFRLDDIIQKYKKEELKKEELKKEAIGYKIKPKYVDAYVILFKKGVSSNNTLYEEVSNEKISFEKNSNYYKKAINLGVLDIWFEEVYKEFPKLPEINGYEGVYDKNHNIIRYGCAVFPVKDLKILYSNIDNFNEVVKKNLDKYNRTVSHIKLTSGVEISIEQLKDIVEFLNES